jgi:hypothetical protein
MVEWVKVKDYQDITYHKAEGMARIAFNRPEVRNAFRPLTIQEMIEAFENAWEDPRIGVILLTGNGPASDGKYAFCSGGDQRVRGNAGYVGEDGIPRLNVLKLQRIIRTIPKPVIALVAGYAIGGGHVLHVMCDLTIAAENAIFGQTGPKVGSFDGGFGASYLARIVGQKKAREIWYLCRQYTGAGGPGDGAGEQGGAGRGAGGRGHSLGAGDFREKPAGDSRSEIGLQRRTGRAGRDSGAGRECHPAVLHDRGGPGGAQCVSGEAQAEFP